MSDVGSAIRERRHELGWSQQTLADRAGVSRVQISRIERGSDPKHSTVRKLALALGVSLAELVRRS